MTATVPLPATPGPYLDPGQLPGDFYSYEDLLPRQEFELIGLVASEGGLIRLPRRIPFHVALRVLLTGEPLAAAEAGERGLVTELTETGAALERAQALAGGIARNAPLALAAVKEILRTTQGLDDRAAFEQQDKITAGLISSDDAHEGAQAFAERRAPVWHGR